MEIKKYPMLEPGQSSDPERYQREIGFWSMVGTSNSILNPSEGVVDWLAKYKEPSVNLFLDDLSTYFSNIPLEEMVAILSVLLAIVALRKIREERKKAQEPQPWDGREQLEVLAFLRKTLKDRDAAKRLREEGERCGEKAPQYPIFEGISLHLDGLAALGAKKLIEFGNARRPTDRELHQLIRLRTAKALAGAGQFDQADQCYAELAAEQAGLERAETVRERCNLAMQRAWTWPRTQSYQDHLQNVLLSGKQALGRKAPAGAHKRFMAMKASFHEFSSTLYLLKTPRSYWQRRHLSGIESAIKEFMALDPTTGRNRHTHLAALYLRASLPEEALRCLSAVRDQIESRMEKGLSWLVEGQALRLLEGRTKTKKHAAAFRNAEEHFETIPGDRFRRVARWLRVKGDPEATVLSEVGAWAGNMLGGNRIIGSFVVNLPTIKS